MKYPSLVSNHTFYALRRILIRTLRHVGIQLHQRQFAYRLTSEGPFGPLLPSENTPIRQQSQVN